MKEINKNAQIEEKATSPDGIDGTHLQGEFIGDYYQLCRAFGEPSEGDGYKVDAEWAVMTPAGIATIYNYKDGKNYCGPDGTPKTKIKDWHIGGRNVNAVAWVRLALLTMED